MNPLSSRNSKRALTGASIQFLRVVRGEHLLSPHPGPLPWGEGGHNTMRRYAEPLPSICRDKTRTLSLGRGQGEGKGVVKWHRRSRTDIRPTKSRDGFTLIEIMVVVVILGILAATIIPRFIGTTQEAKVSTAKANVAELESALERFNIHMDRYPTSEEGLKVLVEPPTGDDKKWRGPYIKMLRPDPWGHPYEYRRPGVHHTTSFDLWSRGADGADGGENDDADVGNW